ncbi:MAG: peptidoglycan-binding domain-containing protein [Candidatus Omnitrophota bacterium]
MRKIMLVVSLFVLAVSFYGCGKKQQALEDMQQPMSMETLATMNTASLNESKVFEPKVEGVSAAVPTQPAKLEPLPPAGPYKPSVNEIQTALKNAGFYSGTIDGKIGPNTKKAITEFQKSQGLAVDGKVGPKTWDVLNKYLNPVAKATGKSR